MDEAGTWHGGRPQPRRRCVRWGPSPLPQKGAEPPPQFSVHFYCGQRAACIKMPLGIELGLGSGDFVLDGDPAAPSPKGHRPPIFGPYLLRPNGCMNQDVTWYGARPRPRRLCVRWNPVAPSPKGGRTPKFSVRVYCDQTAEWMKLILGMVVGLSPGEFVLDGDPTPSPKGAKLPPQF